MIQQISTEKRRQTPRCLKTNSCSVEAFDLRREVELLKHSFPATGKYIIKRAGSVCVRENGSIDQCYVGWVVEEELRQKHQKSEEGKTALVLEIDARLHTML